MKQYALTALGVVFASTILGIAWSDVQWLVAALGVGLGFGLQEIVANFVSGSPGDGISIGVLNHGSVNVIERNTSVENAGCDVNDRSDGGNTWTNNRFGTSCGAASAQASATPARGSARATPAESSLTPEDED